MQLLTAVNQILSTLGEAQVSTIDSQHMTVYKILSALELHKQLLLERGWWFNTCTETMYLDTNNQLEAPVNALSVEDTTGTLLLTIRDGMLFNSSDNTEYFEEAITIFSTLNLAFEDLPICAASVVMNLAKIQVYTDDLGVDSVIEVAQAELNRDMRQLEMMHIRSMRHSTKNKRSWAKLQNALRG